MNVNKLLVLLVFIPFFSFAQKHKLDVFFLLENNNSEFIFSTETGEINSETNLYNIDNFHFFRRDQYKAHKNDLQKFNKKLKDLGRNPTIEEFNQRPKLNSWDFEVISREKVTISKYKLLKLNLVDFEWLRKNSWKENNPNILFKDLYFIFKIEVDTYILYKVERTIIID